MLQLLIHRFAAWHRRRAAIHRLQLMDDWLLADMGTSRTDIAQFVSQLDHCTEN